MNTTALSAPSWALARDREMTYAAAGQVLARWLHPAGLRVSPLGPAYSTDVDAYVTSRPGDAELRAAGWICLDPLLNRLGSNGRGRWAVVAHGRVIGKVDLHPGLPPDPVAHIVARCRTEGTRQRELAELARLRSEGRSVPARLPSRSLRSRLGAARHRMGTPWARRLVVGLSGVDGSGKSTLARELLVSLDRAGVPGVRISVRPGVLAPWLGRTVNHVKKVARMDAAPGLQVATESSTPVAGLRSRRGIVGKLWLTAVAFEFGAAVWREYLTSRGVVIFDRHRADARVTVAVFYGVPASGRFARLFAALVPRAAVTAYLDLSDEIAVHRKQDVFVGPPAVRSQIALYRALLLPATGDTVILDATAPVKDLTLQIFETLVDSTRWRR